MLDDALASKISREITAKFAAIFVYISTVNTRIHKLVFMTDGIVC